LGQSNQYGLSCHQRLYLHKYLGKAPYEIITSKKPKVHYLRVFGSKCVRLNKKTKSSRFAPKVDEGFLLGYGTNEHAYHVFNKTTSCVEVTVDVTFDKSNGSQVELVDKNLVDEEEPPSLLIMRMSLGEVRSREVQPQTSVEERNNDPSSSTRVEPPSSQQPQDQSQVHGEDRVHGIDQGGEQGGEAQEVAPQVENDDDGPIQPQSQVPHLRVHQSIQRDHPVDNIFGSIQRGVTTRSCLATFCEHYLFVLATFYGYYSFVSSFEPLKIDEALDDPDWVIAMQEESNNFTRNEVWEFVE
jgi:hypothetical protein